MKTLYPSLQPSLPSQPSQLPLPPLPSQAKPKDLLPHKAPSHQSIGRRLGRLCEKILIVCCVTLFLALLVAALFNANAAEKNGDKTHTRPSVKFSSHLELKSLLLQAIRKKAWSGRYETGRLKTILPSDFPKKGRLRVHSLLWDEASRRFSALVEVAGIRPFAEHHEKRVREHKVSLSGEAIPYVRVLAARRTLLYGTRIARADLKTIELPTSRKLRAALTDIRQALGMEIRFRRRAGEVLRARDLRPARLVKRRSTVQVTYNHEGVRVVLQALALNDGAHGETVRLRNRFSGREFSAIVDGAGHAKIISETTFDREAEAMRDARVNEGEELALKASRQKAKSEQNPAEGNPFRAVRQRRYDNLLNEPLAGREG